MCTAQVNKAEGRMLNFPLAIEYSPRTIEISWQLLITNARQEKQWKGNKFHIHILLWHIMIAVNFAAANSFEGSDLKIDT